jgi:hypothetical protein
MLPIELATKDYDKPLARQSVQAQAVPSAIDDLPFGLGRFDGTLWVNLSRFAEEIPYWSIYPGARDFYLRNLAKHEPMMASALYSMKTRMVTLGFEAQGPKRAKKYAQEILRTADFGRGIESLLAKGTDDLLGTDNGLFIERIGTGRPDKPLRGPVIAIAHLDSRRCYRTFNPEFPVIYDNPESGQMHKLHYTRVAMTSDNPQPIERARGIGFCAVSRALQWVRIIRDTLTYREEKVSGRFTRGIGLVTGISKQQLQEALQANANDAESAGFVVYKGIPILAAPGYQGKSDADILIKDLASIPDGFEFESDLTLYAYVLAFAFGVDAREFWPATASGATKADATVQNQKARGRGIGALIRTWEWVLRQCLPETVEFTFDFTDDEQDLMKHQVQGARINNIARLQQMGALSGMEVRAISIAEGMVDPKVLEAVASPPVEEGAPDEGEVTTPEKEPTDEDTPEGEGGEKTQLQLPFVEKSLSSYQSGVNSAARGLWNGSLTILGFTAAMESSVTRGLTQGWYEGAAQCGIQPEDLTEDEINALQKLIADNVQYVPGLADYIEANSKANGVTFDSLSSRLELWINRYGEARNLGKLKACADQKLKWVLGATEQHCDDCGGVADRVYRASTWDKYGWEPRSSKLQCTGRRCDCELELTDERVTPGRPPAIVGQKEHAHTH